MRGLIGDLKVRSRAPALCAASALPMAVASTGSKATSCRAHHLPAAALAPHTAQTMEAWSAFEAIEGSGRAKQLGVSNIYDLQVGQGQGRVRVRVWARVSVVLELRLGRGFGPGPDLSTDRTPFNTNRLQDLKALYAQARVKPAVVQNRWAAAARHMRVAWAPRATRASGGRGTMLKYWPAGHGSTGARCKLELPSWVLS